MNTFQKLSCRVLIIFAQAIFLVLLIDSCTSDQDLSPSRKISGARTMCPSGEHWDNDSGQCVPDQTAVDCSQIQNIQNTERDKAVARYGSSGGSRFDQLQSDSNPYDDISNFSSAVYNYERQIEVAVTDGAKDYINTFSGTCSTCVVDGYYSSDFLNKVNDHLIPLKNTITNDGSLTDVQRSVLLSGIQAVYDNWDDISSLIENHDGCFPSPAWYNNSNGMETNGFFQGLIKTIKKVVNIVASVVVNIISYAVNGAIIGALFSCAGQSEVSGACAAPGILSGGILGGLAGLVVGIVRVSNGTYDACLAPPCS